MKRKIKIRGSNFGTDKTNISIFLDLIEENGKITPEKYRINVISVTPNEILAFIAGGVSGKYKLRIVINPLGNNTPGNDDFIYEIVHLSTSPKVSSLQGGNIISITG